MAGSIRPSRLEPEGSGEDGSGGPQSPAPTPLRRQRIKKERERGDAAGTSQQPALTLLPVPNLRDRVVELGLDWDEFIVPAKDLQGHGEKLSLYCQPGFFTEMASIVEAKVWPYDSMSSLVRHAIKRHLVWLRSIDGTESSVLNMTLAIEEVVRQEQFYQQFGRVFENAAEIADRYQRAGQVSLASQFLGRLWGMIQAMPGGSRRNWYETTFKTRFGEVEREDGSSDEV